MKIQISQINKAIILNMTSTKFNWWVQLTDINDNDLEKLKQFLGKVEIDEDQNEFGIPDASKGITYAVMTLWIHNFWNGSKFIETTNVTVS